MPDSHVLVGREQEVRLLGDSLEKTMQGVGHALLISGEAGIGKTRLARYGLQEATDRGFLALSGRSPPLGWHLGYAPIVQAFGGWLRNQPSEERRQFTQGLSSLGVLFEDLDLSPSLRGTDPALDKTRVFEAVVRLLGRIASKAPVVIFLDDLHWADPESLDLLLYLSHELSGLPVLLLSTHRPEDGSAHHPRRLRLLRESLLRNAPSREIRLERLSMSEVETMVADRLGASPTDRLARVLIERSQGVPLFVEGLLRWLVDAGDLEEADGRLHLVEEEEIGLPPLVRDTIIGRLDQLSPIARSALDMIAVAEEAPLHILRAVDAWLSESLPPLIRAGLVIEDDDRPFPTYRLDHPAILEVAYEEISPAERRRLHTALGHAYETAGDLIAAATHFLATGPGAEAEREVEVMLGAGEESLRRYADEQAARFFHGALAHAGPDRQEALKRALLGLGQARYRLGQLTEAIQAFTSLADLESDSSDPYQTARLHRLIASVESEIGDFEAADRHVEAGLSALAGMPPSEERLDLLGVRAVTAARRPNLEDMERTAERFFGEAAEVRTLRVEVQEGIGRASIHHHKGEYSLAAQVLEDLVEPAEQFGDATLLRPVYDLRGVMTAALGDLEALRVANRRSLDLGRRVGVPGWSYRLYTSQFSEAYLSGDWDQAREVLREARLAAEKIRNPRTVPVVSALEAMISTFEGRFEDAVEHLVTGRSLLAESPLPPNLAGMVFDVVSALLSLESDASSAALAAIEPIKSHLEAVFPPWGLVALAESAAREGRLDIVRESTARLKSGGEGTLPAAMAERILGLVETFEGRPDEGIARMLRAEQILGALGMPFERARVVIEVGEAMARAAPGRLEGYLDQLSRSHDVVARLGASRYEERAGALLAGAGQPISQLEISVDQELTPRQLEVAELVAKGLSNAEIAEDLFISIRTVTSHLDHIYTRLGISSRAALATYVTELRHERSTTRLRNPSDESRSVTSEDGSVPTTEQ